jgi:uncharacterized protein (DUF4415 family)
MRRAALSGLNARQRADLKRLAALPDRVIDTSDIPEVLDLEAAKRGVFYRPIKQQITLRIDADVVAWFRSHTSAPDRYQANMNRALREHVLRNSAQIRPAATSSASGTRRG